MRLGPNNRRMKSRGNGSRRNGPQRSNGMDSNGYAVSSGMYIYSLISNSVIKTEKMLLIK